MRNLLNRNEFILEAQRNDGFETITPIEFCVKTDTKTF